MVGDDHCEQQAGAMATFGEGPQALAEAEVELLEAAQLSKPFGDWPG